MPGIIRRARGLRISPQPVYRPSRSPGSPDRPAGSTTGPAAAMPNDPGGMSRFQANLPSNGLTTPRIRNQHAGSMYPFHYWQCIRIQASRTTKIERTRLAGPGPWSSSAAGQGPGTGLRSPHQGCQFPKIFYYSTRILICQLNSCLCNRFGA